MIGYTAITHACGLDDSLAFLRGVLILVQDQKGFIAAWVNINDRIGETAARVRNEGGRQYKWRCKGPRRAPRALARKNPKVAPLDFGTVQTRAISPGADADESGTGGATYSWSRRGLVAAE